MKTYLITGGAGFIGANFIKYILNKYGESIKVINLDVLTYAGNLENLSEIETYDNYVFIKGDIVDRKTVREIFENNEIDYVVNFAAESHVDRSIEGSEPFFRTNVMGTLTLVDEAKKAWENSDGTYKNGVKYIQISTDEVYGSLAEVGYFTESTPINPHSPYSASKASADMLVKAYADTYKLPINITRCSNNYGEYQFPEKLIPLTIDNILNNKAIPVYGDGKNVRDWLYVKDHCSAIDTVINKGKIGEVYNVGGNSERENIFIVETLIKTVKRILNDDEKYYWINENLITYVEDRKGHDRRYAIDATKIKEELGWAPSINFDDGIYKTVKWYIDNNQWIENIKNR